MKHGFITVATAIPAVKVANIDYNATQICKQINEAESRGAEIIVFPELSLTGYTCQDLFTQQLLIEQAENALKQLLDETKALDIIAIVGAPVVADSILLNCAIVFQHGKIMGIVPKTYLPNYGEFYEKRWFASAQDLRSTEITYAGNTITILPTPQLFATAQGVKFGVEICEDVWAPVPPSNHLSLAGATLIFNLSASDELIGKHQYLKSLIEQQSARTISGYIYSGCGFGESTQDVVYGGNAFIYENGSLIAEAERFSFNEQLIVNQIDIDKLRAERKKNTTFVNAQRKVDVRTPVVYAEETQEKKFELLREINPTPFIPNDNHMQETCDEILNIQVAGLAKRLTHIGCSRVVLGISGGLDSTLALLVCVRTFDKLNLDRKGIFGITMPGFGTTGRTYQNALKLMQSLGITMKEISIKDAVIQHFKDIEHDINVSDVTYENSQARERTQILMDLSNKVNGIVVGTGDLSELALGWATYNGDHMSMYNVNVSIPKTLIRYLVRYIAEYQMDTETKNTLLDIIDTPISPELTPANEKGEIKQKTEDLVGPYELHDFFLYHFMRFGYTPEKLFVLAQKAFANKYDDATIKKWLKTFLKRFFNQQFKRSCLPDGPKVGSVSLSPRGDWRMPSDADNQNWIQSIDAL